MPDLTTIGAVVGLAYLAYLALRQAAAFQRQQDEDASESVAAMQQQIDSGSRTALATTERK